MRCVSSYTRICQRIKALVAENGSSWGLSMVAVFGRNRCGRFESGTCMRPFNFERCYCIPLGVADKSHCMRRCLESHAICFAVSMAAVLLAPVAVRGDNEGLVSHSKHVCPASIHRAQQGLNDLATHADQDIGTPCSCSPPECVTDAAIHTAHNGACEAAASINECISRVRSLSLEPGSTSPQYPQQPQPSSYAEQVLQQPLDDAQPRAFDLAAVADLIAAGRARRIICMCGAGISVSAGIPDFRSPGTGLYSQLQKYQLPFPEAVFSINYFRHNPKPFYMLAKELFPGTFLPTPAHHFMRLLADKGMLLRCYTQNIDALELQAGVPAERVVAAHGSFDGAHCIDCGKQHSLYHVQAAVFDDSIATCCHCNGLVKPNIVFFGEPLPARFHRQRAMDFPHCDLLIVMGTSLVVQPFAGLIDAVPPTTPRLLINRERVGEKHVPEFCSSSDGSDSSGHGTGSVPKSSGFDFSKGSRDALLLGDCDGGVRQLAQLLGWEEEMHALMQAARLEWEAAGEE